MTPAELREAAERLLDDSDKGYWVRATKHCKVTDMEAIARHYLAEHPADDETPIDEAWLASFADPWIRGDGTILRYTITDANEDIYLAFERGRVVIDVDETSAALPHTRTRGQLRRLCAALGITLREPLPSSSSKTGESGECAPS